MTGQHYEPTDTERQRARLRELLSGWYVWPTLIQDSGTTDWSAMPDGASSAAATAHSPDDLIEAVKAWDVNAYIKKTEAELADTPDDWIHKREMLTSNLRAARKLQDGSGPHD